MPSLTRTFQTRLTGDQPALAAAAELFSRVARKVDAALARGEDAREVARTYWEPNGISAKNLDHVLRQVLGKRKAVVELARVQAEDLKTRIKAKQRQIERKRRLRAELPNLIAALKTNSEPGAARRLRRAERLHAHLPSTLHQHARRLSRLKDMLAAAERRIERPGICHGSRGLFLRQFHLKENGYVDHEGWLAAWRSQRSSQFMVEGDSGQSSGNQFVRVTAREDGAFDLEVRLPPALRYMAERTWKEGRYDLAAVDLHGLRFVQGATSIKAALAEGKPISWRFVRDATSWRVMAMVGLEVAETVGTDWQHGCLAVDLNADHVALCHVSHDGNPLAAWRLPLVTYGLSEGQRLDRVRKTCARIRELAEGLKVPVASEVLDFRKKKAQLTSDDGAAYARTLSSFAYSSFHVALRSACVRAGVRHVRVNPAYTSLIGRVRFARPYGLSVHAAAALSIGRRAMGHSERPPVTVHAEKEWGTAVPTFPVPLDGGGSCTLPSPVRMRSGPRGARRHVWTVWGRVSKEWQAAHEAHARSGREARSMPASEGRPLPAGGVAGAAAPIARGRRRPSREVVGATACPGAGGRPQGRPSRQISARKSG